MAARTRKIMHDEETRARIKTSQLVNRLTSHVLGEVEMVPSQVSAALGLLRKTLPDLATTMIQGDPDNPLTVVNRVERHIMGQAKVQPEEAAVIPTAH